MPLHPAPTALSVVDTDCLWQTQTICGGHRLYVVDTDCLSQKHTVCEGHRLPETYTDCLWRTQTYSDRQRLSLTSEHVKAGYVFHDPRQTIFSGAPRHIPCPVRYNGGTTADTFPPGNRISRGEMAGNYRSVVLPTYSFLPSLPRKSDFPGERRRRLYLRYIGLPLSHLRWI